MKVDANRDGQRLDNFLLGQLKGVPKSAVYRLIRTGQVRVDGGRSKPTRKLSAGQTVRIPPVRTAGSSGPAPVSQAVLDQVRAAIVFENADYLVVDKPAGMAVHAGSGLAWGLIDAVRRLRGDGFVELAHRIDRETSGCVVLALNGRALRHLSDAFREGRVIKRYLCLLDGRLLDPVVTLNAPIGRAETGPGEGGVPKMAVIESGKRAKTRFTELERYRYCTYVEAELFTGRTHQIRVHAAHLDAPLAGDPRYGDPLALERWANRGLRRLFLHAHRLEFEDEHGEGIAVSAPLPPELRAVLARLDA
ncbi:RluA family pseudouridine synthase [Elongatibacter sediminis]|uniref:Pseudouridine synthase n=1 Tax=Elongatibacter sediminis TaxID=3119006 RepID=A0AAW9R9N1_9GAMM